MLIYQTINLINGKTYIGQDSRNRENYLGSGKALRNAIQKYGSRSFEKKILEICNSKEQLNTREIFWIKKLNSKFPNGYNLTDGGNGTLNLPEVARLKMSIVNIGNKNALGYRHTQEEKEKMRKFWADFFLTDAGKKKAKNHSEKMKGKIPWNKNMKLGPCSESTKIKLREMFKGRLPWNTGLTKETDERVRKMGRNVSVALKDKPKSKKHIENAKRALKEKRLSSHEDH